MKSLIAITTIAAAGTSAYAVAVKPVGYSFTPGTANKGSYLVQYADDPSNPQLIDGNYGQTTRIRSQEQANPWLGWLAPKTGDLDVDGFDDGIAQFAVDIFFNFDQLYTFDSVTVNVLQDCLDNIVVPDVTFFASTDGASWNQVGQILTETSDANDYKFHALTLGGLNLEAQFIQVRLTVNDNGKDTAGRWIFADEVTFAAVPEGGATLVLLGLGFLGLAGLKRKAS